MIWFGGTIFSTSKESMIHSKCLVKGTVMQIERVLINDRLCVSKVS